MTKPSLYWICREQDVVMTRICDMLQLPQDENLLSEKELELIHQILQAADNEAHAAVIEQVRRYKEKRDARD